MTRKKKRPRVTTQAAATPQTAATPWWKKKELYVTAILGGVTALIFGIIQTMTEDAIGLSDSDSSPISTPMSSSPTPSDKPLKVTKVTMVPRQMDLTWVTPFQVDAATLAKLNKEIRAAGGLESEGTDQAMRALGAVETTMSTVEIEVEGNRADPIRIVNVRPITECEKPLTGTLFYAHPQGESDTVKLGFDLDSARPIAQEVKEDPDGLEPIFTGDYFADHKYTLEREEQLTFRFSARTYKSYCKYRYEFEMIVDDKPYRQLVDDHGRPFQVTAEVRKKPYGQGTVMCTAYKRLYARDAYSAIGDPAKVEPWLAFKDVQSFC